MSDSNVGGVASQHISGKKIKVLVVSAFFLPGYKGGGPIKTLKNLFDHVGDEITFKLITSDRDLGDTSSYTSITYRGWNRVGNASVFYIKPGIIGQVQVARHLFAKDYDLVYLNSFFSPRFSFIPLLFTKVLRKKVILSPRGEFSKGALSFKSIKKLVFIGLFKILGMHRVAIFQASSDFEKADIRGILGTSVDIRVAENIGAQEFAGQLRLNAPGPLKSVFISRITPKKNLLAALEMLQKVQQPVVYDIFGPIEDHSYWQECEKKMATLPSHIQVKYKGTLKPDKVVNTLEKYDVFFFPTRGENYGHVIAEALCAGVPILIANTTPWRNLQTLGIGWDFPLSSPDAFSAALDELATMPAEDKLRIRENVLIWAKNKFSQHDTIEANITLFKYAYEKR